MDSGKLEYVVTSNIQEPAVPSLVQRNKVQLIYIHISFDLVFCSDMEYGIIGIERVILCFMFCFVMVMF